MGKKLNTTVERKIVILVAVLKPAKSVSPKLDLATPRGG